MQIEEKIKYLIEVFKVANDDVIGNTARQVFNFKWKEGLSSRNQAHKVLDQLALTNKIQKGKSFFAVKEYKGEFKEHDRLVTQVIARLISVKLPITVLREVSFPIGLRSDLVTLIGKAAKGACAIIEVANNETPAYINQKITAWRNWRGAEEHLSKLFNTRIPNFSIVLYGISHPEAIDFETFLEEVKK
jgi:hypothetical protein